MQSIKSNRPIKNPHAELTMHHKASHRHITIKKENSQALSREILARVESGLMDALKKELATRQPIVKVRPFQILSKDFFVLVIELIGIAVSIIF